MFLLQGADSRYLINRCFEICLLAKFLYAFFDNVGQNWSPLNTHLYNDYDL